MIARTNLEDRLKKHRSREISEADLLDEIKNILDRDNQKDESVQNQLQASSNKDHNTFDIDLLETDRIFHLDHIKAICIDYRLRFLPAAYFKGEWPVEAVDKIQQLETQHNTELSDLRIVAPAKRLRLENADDPLLLAPLGNDYYYLIHKWGNDLHPFRKWLMWPYKNFENMVFTVFLISIGLTLLSPIGLLHPEPGPREYLLTFLFLFKCVGFVVLYYGFAKGKNFNEAIWNSKYYNA